MFFDGNYPPPTKHKHELNVNVFLKCKGSGLIEEYAVTAATVHFSDNDYNLDPRRIMYEYICCREFIPERLSTYIPLLPRSSGFIQTML